MTTPPARRPEARRSSGRARSAAERTAVLVLVSLLGACSLGRTDPAPPVGSASTPAPSVSPTPEPPAEPERSPYTGRKGGLGTPVMVVKMDNTPSAQPHRGLTRADIVYVEPVEFGLTRIAALFSARMPTTVGPVRSARISDVELFAQYGDIAFVYSGAQTKLRPILGRADWTQVTPDLDSPGFFRESGGRVAPYNLMAQPERILATAGATAVSADMGLLFDPEPLAGGRTARNVTARWPSSTVQFVWDASRGSYDVSLNGRTARDTDPPQVQRAHSVIVQYVKQKDSGFGDKFGGRTPLTITTGKGRGLLLRDGRAHRITWQRADEQVPTSYVDSDGEPVVLDRGQLWILLMDRTREVSLD
ncbi:MAG: DUF3048 domain-containing protein [Candidatus Nanopelagicales bacterium]